MTNTMDILYNAKWIGNEQHNFSVPNGRIQETSAGVAMGIAICLNLN